MECAVVRLLYSPIKTRFYVKRLTLSALAVATLPLPPSCPLCPSAPLALTTNAPFTTSVKISTGNLKGHVQ